MQPQVIERLPSHIRGDERMAVPIAADPGADAEARQTLGPAQQRRVESEMLPGLAQAPIQSRQHLRKHRIEVVHDVAALGGHIRLVQEDLAGPPQQRQQRLDLFADGALLVGRPHPVLTLHQQEIQVAVMLEDDGALGLGGVGGQDQLDAHLRQRRGNLIRR